MATHFNFQNLRGLLSAIPTLSDGQIYLATDTGGVYIGNSGTNVLIGRTIALDTNGTPNGDQTKLNLVNGTNITITDDGTGDITIAGPSALPPSGTAGGDLSGTYPNPTVAKVNGGSVPSSQPFVGTDSSSRIVAATAGALPNGTTATTQTPLDGSTKVATDAYADAAATAAASGKQNTLTGTGIARNTGACTELSGDVTTSGSNAASVVKVNGGSIPVSATVVGTDGSSHIVDASSATLSNNTSGTAANLSGTPTLPNGTAATTQSQGDNSTKLATTAYTDAAVVAAGASLGFIFGAYGSTKAWGAGANGTAYGANKAAAFLTYVPSKMTLTKASIHVNAVSASASQFASVGLYDTSGNKVFDSGTFNVSSGQATGDKTNTVAGVVVPKGWYYYVFTTNSTDATFGFGISTTAADALMNKNQNRVGLVANTTSGALNTSMGSFGTVAAENPVLALFEP